MGGVASGAPRDPGEAEASVQFTELFSQLRDMHLGDEFIAADDALPTYDCIDAEDIDALVFPV